MRVCGQPGAWSGMKFQHCVLSELRCCDNNVRKRCSGEKDDRKVLTETAQAV